MNNNGPTVAVVGEAIRLQVRNVAVSLDVSAARQLGVALLRAAAQAERSILKRRRDEAGQ